MVRSELKFLRGQNDVLLALAWIAIEKEWILCKVKCVFCFFNNIVLRYCWSFLMYVIVTDLYFMGLLLNVMVLLWLHQVL